MQAGESIKSGKRVKTEAGGKVGALFFFGRAVLYWLCWMVVFGCAVGHVYASGSGSHQEVGGKVGAF